MPTDQERLRHPSGVEIEAVARQIALQHVGYANYWMPYVGQATDGIILARALQRAGITE